MANTHGFQLATEVSVPFLRAFLRAAWKTGGKKLGEPLDPGTIPESLNIVPGTKFGSFVVQDGQIQIPKDELDIALVAGVGADIKFGIRGQAHLQNAENPAVPSLSLRDITADVHIVAAIGPLVGPGHAPHEIGIDLKSATPTAKLTGVDPSAKLDVVIQEQVNSLAAGAPALPPEPGVPFLYKGVVAYKATELLEVLSDATHHVDVKQLPQVPPRLRVSIPVKFSLYSVVPMAVDPPPPLLEGFLVEATLVASPLLEADPGSPGGHTVQLNAPTTDIAVENVKPGGATAHYLGNQMRLGAQFDGIVVDHICHQGSSFLAQLGNLKISVPTVASIEQALASMLQTALATLDSISIWPPKDSAEPPLKIQDVQVKVLVEGLVLGINPEPDVEHLLVDILPFDRDLAVEISAAGLQNIFETQKRLHDPLHRYQDDDDDEFDLTALSLGLKAGAMRLDGKMTVIDAIGPIDVDASFGVDVHLKWTPDHKIQATADKPDVDVELSLLAEIITLVAGFVTAGALGLVIVAIVEKLAETVAENIGSHVAEDPDFTSVAAWPSDLPKIGNVTANFDNPIDITAERLLFSAVVAP